MNGGWEDSPEAEAEELAAFEAGDPYGEFDGWPEPDPMMACEYWLHKRDAERGEV